MNVEIVTIGDELLLGFTIDTNAAHLARELASIGVRIVRRATVGDTAEDVAAAVGDALARTGAVITTGGLGPTSDDLTKPAIASLFGRGMHFHEDLWEELRARWRERGRAGEPPEANRQQVTLPQGAEVLRNRHGSAPGVWLENEAGSWVAMLPGVPREMRGLLADELLPRIRARAGAGSVVRSLTLRTTGVPESQLPDLLGDLAGGAPGVTLAYLPSPAGVDLRLTSAGLPAERADARLAEIASALRERAGKYVYAEGDVDMAALVLERCRHAGYRIAVAESCTGGLLGARLTAIAGSSDVVLGGVIAYHDDVKQTLLGVPRELLDAHGAVSEPVAVAMADGARRATRAEIGVGITGVAGPGGGSAEKPVGTVWIAVDVAGKRWAWLGRLWGDREEVRFRATQAALEMIRRLLDDEARDARSPVARWESAPEISPSTRIQ